MTLFAELDPPPVALPPPATERLMFGLLHRRYGAESMNARRFAVAEHVASGKFTGKARIADFMAIDCYMAQSPRLPLRNEIHGHEVKVSRSDWLTELRDPSKAETFRMYCHRWWLVAGDPTIVRDGELPGGWGLLVRHGSQLRVHVRAPLLDPEPMDSAQLAMFARAVQKTAMRRGVDA